MERRRARTENREERLDRKGRRAIGWGAGIIVLGFFFGFFVAFLPVFTGWALNPPFTVGPFAVGYDAFMVLGTLIVSAVGLALLIYGMVELGRANRHHERSA